MTKSKSAAFIWNSIEKFGNEGVQFCIGIILARILSPSDYGVVGILLVFTAIAQILIDSGFTKALIQKNDKSKDDISTVFTFNLVIASSIYIVLWFCAPYISSFYGEPSLVSLLRVLSLVLISNALFAIPNTLLSIDLDFKTIAKINSSAIILSGLFAIFLAYNGFGVWALVFQYLSRSVLMLLFFTISNTYKYRIYFSKSSFKNLFKFGSNLMVSNLLNVVVGKFSSLFIAKVVSTADLGFYTRGMQFPDVAIGTLGSVLDNVLLPSLAKNKDNKSLRSEFERVMKLLHLITLPITIILAVLAEPIVLLLLTDKWIAVVPILQLFCLSRYFNNLISVNINILYVLNKTNLVLRQHYIKIIIRVVLIIAALPFGIIYIAAAEAVTSIIHFIINAYYPGKFLGYGIKKQLSGLYTYLIIALVIFLALTYINSNINSLYFKIIFATLVGTLSFYSLAYLTKKNDFNYLKNFIINRLGKK
ncbi:lipopolysaccharide biosynthesis protein [Maribacter sp. MAR_2009_72]|uniref:lipopolysaccharide biosynthesis protein n=1 Tax=Maribacter sp. MAR_2009_72 TaxID=1250050 RepID=UPI00119B5C2D|nr:lipopolysaccharide biosynthesis protein [Maribacter sp. MAR_2009_72]TVZ13848.1 O-antigen/teichoic acid export membrane protein [Maribacter sp. MAR_2009_72]